MDNELIQFVCFFILCLCLIIYFYKREKKYRYSERGDYALINSYKRFGILITVALIALIKIIVEILKVCN